MGSEYKPLSYELSRLVKNRNFQRNSLGICLYPLKTVFLLQLSYGLRIDTYEQYFPILTSFNRQQIGPARKNMEDSNYYSKYYSSGVIKETMEISPRNQESQGCSVLGIKNAGYSECKASMISLSHYSW